VVPLSQDREARCPWWVHPSSTPSHREASSLQKFKLKLCWERLYSYLVGIGLRESLRVASDTWRPQRWPPSLQQTWCNSWCQGITLFRRLSIKSISRTRMKYHSIEGHLHRRDFHINYRFLQQRKGSHPFMHTWTRRNGGFHPHLILLKIGGTWALVSFQRGGGRVEASSYRGAKEEVRYFDRKMHTAKAYAYIQHHHHFIGGEGGCQFKQLEQIKLVSCPI